VCSSPRLIAAYHVLRRLSVPRHPPCAFLCLISKALEIDFRKIPRLPWHPRNHQLSKSADQRLETEYVRATWAPFRAPPTGPVPTRDSRKEVIQPQVPLRLPCYDFAPVTELTLDGYPLAVSTPASGPPSFHGVTGGVYKARERIHRGMADPRLLAIPASCSRVTDCNPNLDRLLAIGSPSRACDALYRPL
jgi:hypothetical protein